jgi:hypothetical protein
MDEAAAAAAVAADEAISVKALFVRREREDGDGFGDESSTSDETGELSGLSPSDVYIERGGIFVRVDDDELL